ncbi:hypothetical protein EHEL_061120 [Encephalitozoon hellem ATCC 50504]|uniref:Uncharacterized protein n=1 Tax=Encephalitozoon hellem TaxID=27973 RepID=A0A9Q9C3D7_ENCHE|nr:uncharacterized protein EHEL_061120 [Encephalitozoon hellem ATCC 50504]AFM98483.1 hypothetical protein EHEL_061120 [Encephalitozoon hellem ATCC 50504]UTX43409.1 hypothetical protein GPU96_06g11580 [Encephalitozoon hellem]WEL38873.1 hypothetical protein PFJ87_06g01410 [Encephalitozoon hellem]|eukprot:XP_003887464.1 hypothetical protein EHEL_061120 [Encephalitozoon hellem ATCC 50504]
MTREINSKDEESLSLFKRNLRKMILLEEEGRRRRESLNSRKLVSIRVGKIEGIMEEPERKFVEEKRRVFEGPKMEYEREGRVKERIKGFDNQGKRMEERDAESVCAKGFVCLKDKEDEVQGETLGDCGMNGDGINGERSRIVEECKSSVGRELCEVGPEYKDEGVDDDSFKEISVEDIKKSLLAELEEERESDMDVINTVVKSENPMQSEQEVVYVDNVNASPEVEKNPYGAGCNIYAYDTHYKISDLSKGNLGILTSSDEKSPCGQINSESSTKEVVDGSLEAGAVTYQDPEEEKNEGGWFSSIFGSIFSTCCGG